MWQWNPAKCIASDLTTRSAASRALPFDTVKPNFESSAPVAMYSWVCASTPGRDPHQHAGGSGVVSRHERVDAIELVEGVGDDAPDAPLQRQLQLGVGLVVAVEDDAAGREAGVERELQLAAGGDVEVQALVGHQAGHGTAQERLAGVRHRAGTERLAVLGRRGPAVRSRSTRRAACRAHAPARRGRRRRSPAVRRRRRLPCAAATPSRAGRRQTRRGGRVAAHDSGSSSSSSSRDISSGACTPSTASALARPRRHASANQSRACVSAASSEITRQSR